MDHHLLYRVLGEVRVKRSAAYLNERRERSAVFCVGLAFSLDQFGEALSEFGHAQLELLYGVLPDRKGRRTPRKEQIKEVNELGGISEVRVHELRAVLIEDRPPRFLEEDVLAWIAGLELGLNLLLKIVVCVLGFPKAIGEDATQRVDDSSVRDDRFGTLPFQRVLRDQRTSDLARAVFQKVFECGRHSAFVLDAKSVELLQRRVELGNGLVLRLQAQ